MTFPSLIANDIRPWVRPSPHCLVVRRNANSGEGSLQLDDRLAALAIESLRHLDEQTAHALGDHHKCSVEGCPCRMDFSRAQAALIASSGRATSMSLRGDLMGWSDMGDEI